MSDVIHHAPPVLTFDGYVPAVIGFYNIYDAFAEAGLLQTDQMARIELVAIMDGEVEEVFHPSPDAQYVFKTTYRYGPVSGRLDQDTGVLKLNTYSQASHIRLRLRVHVWR